MHLFVFRSFELLVADATRALHLIWVCLAVTPLGLPAMKVFIYGSEIK